MFVSSDISTHTPTMCLQEHQECETIKTRFRPVPLHWHFVYRNGRGTQVRLRTLDAVRQQGVMQRVGGMVLACNRGMQP